MAGLTIENLGKYNASGGRILQERVLARSDGVPFAIDSERTCHLDREGAASLAFRPLWCVSLGGDQSPWDWSWCCWAWRP